MSSISFRAHISSQLYEEYLVVAVVAVMVFVWVGGAG